MRVSPGTRLGHYEIMAALGAGGMGEVYRARDTRLQRPAAIKVITADDNDPERVRRLEREALSASALNHPNILTVYELGVHDGLQYIATELVEGETLREVIRRGPMRLAQTLDIALQVAAALEAAHAAGLVHRDVKPENVMVRPDGYVKVLDFGIAKLVESSPAAAESATLTLQTVPGMLLGTVGYMAPEQIRGLPVDHRADIWSLGVVLHEMLSGRTPFSGPTTSDVIAAVLERTPPALSASGADVPPDIERVVGKTLAKDREDRYQSMKDLLIDLRHARQQPALPAPVPPRQSRTPYLILGAAAMLAVASWAGWIALKDSPGSGQRAFPTRETLPPLPVGTHALKYSLTVERLRNGQPSGEVVDSTGTDTFERTSRFRFNFTSDDAGHVYVINESEGTNRILTMLYPTPSLRAGSAAITPGETIRTGYFFFDSSASVERVWIVWSAKPQAQLESAKRFVNQEYRGEIKDPAEAAAVVGVLNVDAARATTVTANGASKQMVIRGDGEVLVHRVELRTR